MNYIFFYCTECEYNKRIYNNGEKIDTSDMPCRVCYCKGGDVMCTTIGCYEREDCEGKIIPGTCCPKYDHCPPLGKNDFEISIVIAIKVFSNLLKNRIFYLSMERKKI